MYSLTDLPYDAIRLVAAFLLPYDVIALSRTCHALNALQYERAVWMQIAESVSLSRPLPFTATQALDVPIERLIEACLRAERIAKRWAEPQIDSRRQPVKISFPDKRIVTYFTFLPGSRHLMVYDLHNVLSCWTAEGQLLQTWRVNHGAKLTRWKPCDESESSYDFKGRREQAVEIMIEMQRHSGSTHCEIILLIYSDTHAKFEQVNSFKIPRVYEPFSAMTQDELCGSLVGISHMSRERVGIYLSDKNTKRAVCIDTSLNLVLDCVPQALLSSTHMVLYWETLTAAHAVTYEMDVLRSILAREGSDDIESSLRTPIPLTPSDVRVIPFRTVSAPLAGPSTSSGAMHTCSRCGNHIDNSLPSTDLSRNRDAYPVIIPKWHTLREDLRRHRTRSVLTFSRRPNATAGPTSAQALALYINGHNHDLLNVHQHLHEAGEGGGTGPAGNEGQAPAEGDQHGFPAIDPEELYFSRSSNLPRTTITHHYFDYVGASSGSGQPEIIRTVLAEAPLRRPQNLRIPRHHLNPFVMGDGVNEEEDEVEFEGDVELEGFGIQHIGGDEEDEEDEEDEGFEDDGAGAVQLEALGVYDFGAEDDEDFAAENEENGLFAHTDENTNGNTNGNADESHGHEHIDEHVPEHEHDQEQGQVEQNNAATWGDQGANFYDQLEALENGLANFGLGLELGELHGGVDGIPLHMHMNAPHAPGQFGGVDIVDLTADAAQALEEFVQDPFGGSPVMGYGGRCAMWVEEHPKKYRPNGRAPVLRVATFPSFEPVFNDTLPSEEAAKYRRTFSGVPMHPELEVARGRVATLHLPGNVSLESAYTFDLDDVRGVVGIATSFGEVWLVDFS